jgi:hypothetical protein
MERESSSSRYLRRNEMENYQVAITYCDGHVIVHDHPTSTPAAQEYSAVLDEGLNPGRIGQHVRHVHQVGLFVTNDLGQHVHKSESGVFGCPHKPISPHRFSVVPGGDERVPMDEEVPE